MDKRLHYVFGGLPFAPRRRGKQAARKQKSKVPRYALEGYLQRIGCHCSGFSGAELDARLGFWAGKKDADNVSGLLSRANRCGRVDVGVSKDAFKRVRKLAAHQDRRTRAGRYTLKRNAK